MLKASQKRTKRAPLTRGVDVENAGEKRRLIGDDADGAAVQARKADDEIFREVLVDFEEVAVVDDGVNGVLDVVGLLGIVGDQRVERRVAAIGGIGCWRGAADLPRLFEGRKLISSRIMAQAIGVVAGDEVSHAAGGVVGHGAAEFLLGDFLVGDGLDDVGAGDEHVGSFAGHENEIGDRRRIDGAARAGAHDGADLRDDAAGQRVAQENIGVAGERQRRLPGCARRRNRSGR